MRVQLQLFYILLLVSTNVCHIPDHVTTPKAQVDQKCILAEKCMHDTIPVCGQMSDKFRTFMDLCDLLEYGCDTGQVYNHIEEKDCPSSSAKAPTQ